MSGRYAHLGSLRARKTLSYVGNTVYQVRALLECEAAAIDLGVFYLADYSYPSIREWANLIAQEAGRRPPISLPSSVATIVATVGDVLERAGIGHPPLTSRRLQSMRRDQGYRRLDGIQSIAPALPFDLRTGVRETLAWLEKQGGFKD